MCQKLSLKNCEAIANGYDLEELACDKIGIDISVIKYIDNKVIENDSVSTPIHEAGALGAGLYHRVKGFEIGFQKALEILGDKKFSEEDIINAHYQGVTDAPLYEVIQSLQQSEWLVEIEQELIQSSIEGEALWKTKLDSDNCLILKRK